jgi:hypothetical protein
VAGLCHHRELARTGRRVVRDRRVSQVVERSDAISDPDRCERRPEVLGEPVRVDLRAALRVTEDELVVWRRPSQGSSTTPRTARRARGNRRGPPTRDRPALRRRITRGEAWCPVAAAVRHSRPQRRRTRTTHRPVQRSARRHPPRRQLGSTCRRVSVTHRPDRRRDPTRPSFSYRVSSRGRTMVVGFSFRVHRRPAITNPLRTRFQTRRCSPRVPMQPGESKPNSSYFAGRNATWIMKATPGAGWNE